MTYLQREADLGARIDSVEADLSKAIRNEEALREQELTAEWHQLQEEMQNLKDEHNEPVLAEGEHWVDSDPGDAEVGPQPDVHPCNCTDGKHWAYEQDYSSFDPWAGLHHLIREYAHEVADPTSEPPNIRYLNVYIVEREFGGSEEGGWWYDVGTPQGISIVCNTIDAREMQELYDDLVVRFPDRSLRSSMAPQGEDYQVRIERHPPKEWPDPRPHYE